MIPTDFPTRPVEAPSHIEIAISPLRSLSNFSDSSIESKEKIDGLSLSDLPKLDRPILDIASIPLIDLEDIQAAQGDLRAELIEAFGNALQEVGFIAVKADALTRLIQDVNKEMLLYFSQPLEEKMNAAGNLIRLAHYLAPKEGDHPSAVWAGAHEDSNALTLLPPSTIPGLQLLTKEGIWKSVTVPPGYLIVNTGEQLQSKTAGKIRATRHQVVNPGGEYAWQRRFASIFFASWSYDFSLRPFPGCVNAVTAPMTESQKEEYLMQFPDVTVREHLLSRLIEMRTIKDPSEELISSLREKGLLKQYKSEML